MKRLYAVLYVTGFALLAVTPLGVGGGLWLALGAGWGVLGGSVAGGLLGWLLLTADLLPDTDEPREVSR